MKEINRERFEAWLSVNKLEREFNFCSPQECAFCNFIRETTNKFARCSIGYVLFDTQKEAYSRVYNTPPHQRFPDWLAHILHSSRPDQKITIGELTERLGLIFPDSDTGVLSESGTERPANPRTLQNEPANSTPIEFGHQQNQNK